MIFSVQDSERIGKGVFSLAIRSATVHVIDAAKASMPLGWLGKDTVALYCIAQALKELLLFPIEALADAAMLQPSAHAEKNADAIRCGGREVNE